MEVLDFTILVTVSVDVITAKPDSAAIGTHDPVIPPDNFGCWCRTKILGIERRTVSETEDMVLCMIGELDSVTEASG